MVGPSSTAEERRDASLRLKAGFVLLVALSGGLVATTYGASLPQILLVVASGLVVGSALAWWLVRSYREISPHRR